MDTPQKDTAEIADVFRPIYEKTAENPLGQRLVLTTWMLLDELKQCQEELECVLGYVQSTGVGSEVVYGCLHNPLQNRLENAHFNVSHILRLLWRSGLWSEDAVCERTDAHGRTYTVLEQPFTDGKAEGRPLAANTPDWQLALLGLEPIADFARSRTPSEPSALKNAA